MSVHHVMFSRYMYECTYSHRATLNEISKIQNATRFDIHVFIDYVHKKKNVL